MSPDYITKACTKCGKEYPLTDEFWHKSKYHKSGFRNVCKLCTRKQNSEYAKNNKRSNREYKIESYYANREKNIKYSVEWNRSNKERRSEISRRYSQSHPVKVMESVHRRRARKLNAEGNHTNAEVIELFELQCGKCYHCGCDISQYYEEDHWIPLSKGGSDWISNIKLLCMSCNRAKANKLPHEWDSKYLPE